MELFINRDDRRPIATQLYEQVRDAIVEGRVTAGDRLTSSRRLAADLGVSRFTITEVYGRLAAEGYIDGRAGGGSVVATVPVQPGGTRIATALAPTTRAAQIRRFDRDPSRTARFDLRPGRVDNALFPIAAWRHCMLRSMREAPAQYSDPAGTAALRTALARWIARSRGVATTAENIVVTAGAQHAVDLIARVLVEPGSVVAVEEPGYPPVVELLRAHGAVVVGVPVDDEGIVVDAIPPSARLVYVTPSHQFPLGVVLSRRRRIALLQWAGANDAAIIEDDYDSEFRHTVRPLEPLHRLDNDGRVIYVGTFSKSLSPSLRIGFAAVPSSLTPAVHSIRQAVDWCPPIAMQDALTAFIDGGHLDRHLRRARLVYRERHDKVWAVLAEVLPRDAHPLPSHAGLHLAVLLDEDIPARELHVATHANDVIVGSLRRTYHFGDPAPGFLVGFGAVATADVADALEAVAMSLKMARE
jgi:GntR family transcriptional regulator/MocR family aminotransferase